jgi:hypothetical protein
VLLGVEVIANSQPQAQSSVNVKLAAGPRWHVAGFRKVGGNVLFFKFDAFKNFWYLIVHCDSELVEFDHYELDGIPVDLRTRSPSDVRTTSRRISSGHGPAVCWASCRTQRRSSRIWTTTYSPSESDAAGSDRLQGGVSGVDRRPQAGRHHLFGGSHPCRRRQAEVAGLQVAAGRRRAQRAWPDDHRHVEPHLRPAR